MSQSKLFLMDAECSSADVSTEAHDVTLETHKVDLFGFLTSDAEKAAARSHNVTRLFGDWGRHHLGVGSHEGSTPDTFTDDLWVSAETNLVSDLFLRFLKRLLG